MRKLDVHLHGEPVGRLERVEQGRLRFVYLAGIPSDLQPPLSLSLPVRNEAYDDGECRGYFSGLLPEGGFLRAVARAFGVSASNAFAVLDAIGGECAGAVSLSSPGAGAPAGRPPRFLDEAGLHELLAGSPERVLADGFDGEGLRLSLAGAQEKLPVIFDGGRIGITGGEPPSTHIIKLPIAGFVDTVPNESYCLALAAASGLDAVQGRARVASPVVSLGDAPQGSIPFLQVTRYDRTTEPPARRIHQEDFCQALGRPPELKYEAEGGPGVADCAALIGRHSAVPARDRLAFADALLFNVAVGNLDAHAKNYSLILEGEDAPRLAPLYDLMSTSIYPGLTRRLAMRFGGENRPEYIRPRHLERLAGDLGMRPAALRRRADELCERIDGAVPAADEQVAGSFENPEVHARIHDRVRSGVKLLRDVADSGGGPT